MNRRNLSDPIQLLQDVGPHGTVIREPDTMCVWWHPYIQTDARQHFQANKYEWWNLGTERWWPNDDYKQVFNSIERYMGDRFPAWPNEWAVVNAAPFIDVIETEDGS
ncbi:MAG: hypothetical protein RI554_11030 [Trueperaceae bacterium]|nr:hypothetical protein [Trueperaceae bacterium]